MGYKIYDPRAYRWHRMHPILVFMILIESQRADIIPSSNLGRCGAASYRSGVPYSSCEREGRKCAGLRTKCVAAVNGPDDKTPPIRVKENQQPNI